MRNIANIAGAAYGIARGAVSGGLSVVGNLLGRGGGRNPDLAADAGHRSPPEDDLSEDPAYEPPEELKNLKGG